MVSFGTPAACPGGTPAAAAPPHYDPSSSTTAGPGALPGTAPCAHNATLVLANGSTATTCAYAAPQNASSGMVVADLLAPVSAMTEAVMGGGTPAQIGITAQLAAIQ